jgi:tRNA pseudouridine55 synthase
MAVATRGAHGALVIDKPAGVTSFSAMRKAQRVLGEKTAGHAGTLDPMATGVLVVLLGEATKVSNLVMDHDKVYEAKVLLGVETDTLDAEGVVTSTSPVPTEALRPERIEAALAEFVGERMQAPPRFSALKKDGRTHMSRARAGEAFEVEPRMSLCHGLTLLGVDGPTIAVRVHCGKGYYVRSFARDLGRALGTCAHLTALRRTRVGRFDIASAIPPEAATADAVIPIPELIPDVPRLVLEGRLLADIRHGRFAALPTSHSGLAGRSPILGITASGSPVALLSATPEAPSRLRVERGFVAVAEPS